MQAHEGVGLVPMSTGRMPPVHHEDLRIGVGDQRVRERHPPGAASDDEIVGFERSNGHAVPPFTAKIEHEARYGLGQRQY